MTTTEKPDNWDDLEEGSRDDAVIGQDTERHYLVANGKKYWFDMQDPSWKKRNEIMSNALKIDEDGTDLRIDEYYLDMLEHMIEDMSVNTSNTRMFLVGLEPELGQQLQEIAPDPQDGLSDEEEGNSDKHSEDNETDDNQIPA